MSDRWSSFPGGSWSHLVVKEQELVTSTREDMLPTATAYMSTKQDVKMFALVDQNFTKQHLCKSIFMLTVQKSSQRLLISDEIGQCKIHREETVAV